jgi:hypothetical protein
MNKDQQYRLDQFRFALLANLWAAIVQLQNILCKFVMIFCPRSELSYHVCVKG